MGQRVASTPVDQSVQQQYVFYDVRLCIYTLRATVAVSYLELRVVKRAEGREKPSIGPERFTYDLT